MPWTKIMTEPQCFEGCAELPSIDDAKRLGAWDGSVWECPVCSKDHVLTLSEVQPGTLLGSTYQWWEWK